MNNILTYAFNTNNVIVIHGFSSILSFLLSVASSFYVRKELIYPGSNCIQAHGFGGPPVGRFRPVRGAIDEGDIGR